MKRIFIVSLVAFLSLGVVSCKKDKSEDTNGIPSDLGTFAEGIYKPTNKIVSVKEGSTNVQTWSWGSSKLSSITDLTNNLTYSFNYSGDMIGSVIINGSDQTQKIIYTYGGSLLTKVEIINGTRTDVTMNVTHNANDQISSVDLLLSNDYLVSLAKSMLGMKSALQHVVGANAAEAIVETAKLISVAKIDNPKYSISNKTFSINYVWDGNNLIRETLTGNVSATASLVNVADAFNMGSISSIINLIGGDEEFPLSCTVNRTTNYTYDNKHNPLYCCWAQGISADNLSVNNLISAVSTGAAEASITITVPESIPMVGGMTYPFNRNIDLGGNTNYTYTYNKKDLPDTYTVDGKTYTYTYSN